MLAHSDAGTKSEAHRAKILVVDDDLHVRSTTVRVLRPAFDVEAVESAAQALGLLGSGDKVDVIVTDWVMPGMDGFEFLRAIRLFDLDVPVIVVTGHPSIESAMATIEYGGYRYLKKPVEPDQLIKTVTAAAAMHRLAVLKRRALEVCDTAGWEFGDRASLEAHFEGAIRELYIAFQPIVSWREKVTHGYEALMRSADPTLGHPTLILNAAERLGRVHEVGRRIRRLIAESLARAPERATIFVNLHSVDLNDEDLYAPN